MPCLQHHPLAVCGCLVLWAPVLCCELGCCWLALGLDSLTRRCCGVAYPLLLLPAPKTGLGYHDE